MKYSIKRELEKNGNKLSKDFVDSILNDPSVTVMHSELMGNTRFCVIILPSGHNLVGYAQVLDAKNDDQLIGQEVAYNNAADQAWSVLGAIAKEVLNENK